MKYANFWPRALAHLIDFVLTNAVEFAIEYGITKIIPMGPIVEQVMSVTFGLAIAYYYYVVFQLKNGTTIGKKVFHIYVVDAVTGAPMTHKQAVIRALSYIPSYLIVGCGFIMAAFHPQKRALHDLIAGTICIKRDSNPKVL